MAVWPYACLATARYGYMAIWLHGCSMVWLFDTFSGIPDSRYGLDFHWNGSFADNSYAAVKDAFLDMKNVDMN